MWLVDLKVIVTINTFYFLLYTASATAVKSLQSCLTLCDPKDCSLPGSSVNLKQNGKVKKLDKWMSHELITNQKI